MSYLKNNTHYSKALTDVSEREIHRGRLGGSFEAKPFYELISLLQIRFES